MTGRDSRLSVMGREQEFWTVPPCPDCGCTAATRATVYLHLEDCPQANEAVLRERLRGAVDALREEAEACDFFLDSAKRHGDPEPYGMQTMKNRLMALAGRLGGQ